MPLDHAQGQWLNFFAGDLRGKTDKKGAGADAVNGLAGDRLLFDGDAEIEAELKEQFVEDVLLGAVGLEVLHRIEQRLVRFSRSGSQARMLVESSLKTRKPRSPANIGFSSLIFFPARRRRSLVMSAMVARPPTSAARNRFGKLHENAPSVAAISSILRKDAVHGRARTTKEIENKRVSLGLRGKLKHAADEPGRLWRLKDSIRVRKGTDAISSFLASWRVTNFVICPQSLRNTAGLDFGEKTS